MFKLKKQLYLFKIVLFICLGLFLITNNHQVIAMESNNNAATTNGDTTLINLIARKNILKQQIIDVQNNNNENNMRELELQTLKAEYRQVKRRIIIYENISQGIPTRRNQN